MSFGHNTLWWPLAAISSIYINVWSHYIVPHSELSTYWNTIPTEFCLQKKGDFKEMYFLNASYIFVQPLGCACFMISLFSKTKLCQKCVPDTLCYLQCQSERVHGESVCPKMGTDCILNGRLNKCAA